MKRILLAAVLSAVALFLFGCYENQPAQPDGSGAALDDTKEVSSTVLRPAATDESFGVPGWAQTYEIIVENSPR